MAENYDNLKEAMKMEKEYRKLQADHKAKTEFGYHDKLKTLGFDDTIIYEKAKAEHYIKTEPIEIQHWYITSNEELIAYNNARNNDIKEGNDVVRFVTTSVPQVYIGIECVDADRKYCDDNNLLTYPCPGKSAFVTSEYDLQVCITVKNHNLGNILLEKLNQDLEELGISCEISGNDILVAGDKIVGSCDWNMGLVSYYGYGITFKPNNELIDAICHKPRTKNPLGISEISDIQRENLIKRIETWLQ